MTMKRGGRTYDALVDGGINSPWVLINGNPPADPVNPYYLEPGEVTNQVSYDKTKSAGTIQTYDQPTAVANIKISKFETAIVAINYNNTGKDKVIAVFKWGWKDHNKKPRHKGVRLRKRLSRKARKIIKHDYPNYKFINN